VNTRSLAAVAVLALSASLLVGCSEECRTAAMEEQHKAVIRRVHAEISKGNVSVFDEVLADDYVRHCQAMPPGLQEITDRDVFKAFVADFVGAVSDCNDSILFMIAEGDKVAYVTKTTGTQTGVMGDLPASGKEFELYNIVIQRFENGKVAETWISWDNVALLSQLGFFPPPSAENP